jgi:zinc protease
MIKFSQHTLSNGLRVLLHQDTSTPMSGISILYDVGSRDEDPEHTGFAHLFEHLMFSGSKQIPQFDEPLQMAGGDNNAFTTNDYTVYHEVLPTANIETALWLESDRMHSLRIRQSDLNVQRKVVVEEFKETCFQEPYGDLWHHLSPMAFKAHPYEWPVIGAKPEHIANAQLAEVRQFYKRFYAPNNAILAIASPLEESVALALAKKWFEHIEPSIHTTKRPHRIVPPFQSAKKQVEADVPLPAFFLAYPCPPRLHPDFYLADILTDVLADGPSSRFVHRLVKERSLFTQIDAYLSDTVEGGILLIEGNPADGVSIETGLEAVRAELALLQTEALTDYELQKVINRHENSIVYAESSVLNKSQNLCYYAWLGDTDLINTEIDIITAITAEQILEYAQKTFQPDHEILLTYIPKKQEEPD